MESKVSKTKEEPIQKILAKRKADSGFWILSWSRGVVG